jgi:hypothetical protein
MTEAEKPLIAAYLWSSVNTCAIGINQHEPGLENRPERAHQKRECVTFVTHSFNK